MAAEVIKIEVKDMTGPGISQAQKRFTKFEETVRKTQEQIKRLNSMKTELLVAAVDSASAVLEHISANAALLAANPCYITVSASDQASGTFAAISSSAVAMKNAIIHNILEMISSVNAAIVSMRDRITAVWQVPAFQGSGISATGISNGASPPVPTVQQAPENTEKSGGFSGAVEKTKGFVGNVKEVVGIGKEGFGIIKDVYDIYKGIRGMLPGKKPSGKSSTDLVQSTSSLAGNLSSLKIGAESSASSASIPVMNVAAGVVNITGAAAAGGTVSGSGGGGLAGNIGDMIDTAAKLGSKLPDSSNKVLSTIKKTSQFISGESGSGAGGGLGRAALKTAGKTAVSGLAKVGTFLGSGATTTTGAAAAGGGAIAGAALGAAGIYSGVKNFVKGSKLEGKEKQDEYVKGGTKLGMVGYGAAAGAVIGSVVPGAGTAVGAMIGAGVGGLGALLGGDQIGEKLSDGLDIVKEKWGQLSGWFGENVWGPVSGKAEEAGAWISEKFGSAKDWVGEKWGELSGWFGENVWTPISDVGISAINIAVGLWGEAKDWIGEKWGELSDWFGENVWGPISEAATVAGEWISENFNAAKDWIGEKWGDLTEWFGENIWGPVSEAATVAGEWISSNFNAAKDWIGEKWGDFSEWFSESIWGPVSEAATAAASWISENFNAAKDWIGEKWTDFSSWFGENIWGPVKNGALEAGTWIGTQLGAAKDTLINAWQGVSGWFSENVWGPLKSAGSKVFSWIGGKIDDFKNWLSNAGKEGSEQTGMTTSTGNATVLEQAYGGILTSPLVALVAEAGPEAIIPLSSSKRNRGLELWLRAGRMLGVGHHADGAVAGAIPAMPFDTVSGADEEAAMPAAVPVPVSIGVENAAPSVTISVNANPTFAIDGGTDEAQIVSVIRANLRDMADDIGGELAERLAGVFSNMPIRGV